MPQNSNVAIAVGPTTARKPLQANASDVLKTATASGKPPINPNK